jgi:hypothetical protein
MNIHIFAVGVVSYSVKTIMWRNISVYMLSDYMHLIFVIQFYIISEVTSLCIES